MKRKHKRTHAIIDWGLTILEIFIYVPRLLLKGIAKAIKEFDFLP